MAKSDISPIIAYAKEAWPDFPITQHQLEHATSDFAVLSYNKCRETIEQLTERACDGKNFNSIPQNKVDSVFSLLRLMNKYMKRMYPNNNNIWLTLTDLYDPTSKRTIIRLKLLIQFFIFYESIVDMLKDAFTTKFEIQEKLQVKKTNMDNTKGTIAKQVEELVALQDLHTKLKNDKEKATLRYQKLQHLKDDLDRNNKKLRFELKTLVDTYNTKQTLMANVGANIQSLNEQIVTDDSYKSMLELKQNIIQQCEELNSKSECCSQNLQCKKPALDEFKLAYKKNCELLETVKELKIIQTSTNENDNLLQSLKLNYKEKSLELAKYNEDNLKLSNSTQTKKEILNSEVLRHKTMQENIERDVEETYKETEIEREQLRSEKESHLSSISNREKFIENVEASIQRLNAVYEDAYKNIVDSANAVTTNFHNSFTDLCNTYTSKRE